MMVLGIIAFTFLPILFIVILANSKRIGTNKKILFSIIIVVVFLFITAVLLGNVENYINLHHSYVVTYS